MQMFPLNMALNLPEWYRLERETEKTVGRLVNLKELDYYLRNPDEYLRRLAIIRLSELKPRGCENILREMLDDHYESIENKELAAWVLKASALKWNMEIFIDNRHLTKFTGKESLQDIYKISCSELQPSLRFNFSSNKVCSLIPSSEENISCEGHTVADSGFNTRQWLSSFSGSILSSMKSLMLNMLKIIRNALRGLFHLIFIGLSSLLVNGIKNLFKRKEHSQLKDKSSNAPDNRDYHSRLAVSAYNNPDLMPQIMNLRKAYTYKPPVIPSMVSVLKKVVFNVLYVFFYPVRLFLKHKFAFVFILLALYIFLNFTNQGSILFREYTGKEFLEIQTEAADDIKQFSISTWNRFKDFTGLDGILEKGSGKVAKNNDPAPSITVRYLVTASKGLNIRKAPDPNSEKIMGGSLAFGSIVVFLDKITTDSAGKPWYYIKADDGRTGWVSAKYLTVKKEG